MPVPILHRLIRHGLVIALLASVAHLAWEHMHGGVRSHNLLARRDLPAVSNWWGLMVLPLLGWLASRRATRRAASDGAAVTRSIASFLGALIVGLTLASLYSRGLESATTGILLAALAAGLILPTYRAEYIFGFVLGMTFVFGSVLPTFAALLGAGISAVAHFVIHPAVIRLLRVARA